MYPILDLIFSLLFFITVYLNNKLIDKTNILDVLNGKLEKNIVVIDSNLDVTVRIIKIIEKYLGYLHK